MYWLRAVLLDQLFAVSTSSHQPDGYVAPCEAAYDIDLDASLQPTAQALRWELFPLTECDSVAHWVVV